MAGELNEHWDELGVVRIAWPLCFFGKIELLWKSFKKTVQIIDDHPKTDRFVVFFKVLLHGFVEILITCFRTFYRAPVVANNFTISDESSLPFGFRIIFHGSDVAFQVNWFEVGSTCDCLHLFMVLPPAVKGQNLSFCWVDIDTDHSFSSFFAWRTVEEVAAFCYKLWQPFQSSLAFIFKGL